MSDFIMHILWHFTTTCSSVGAFETTYCMDIAYFSHYETHSDAFNFLSLFRKKVGKKSPAALKIGEIALVLLFL